MKHILLFISACFLFLNAVPVAAQPDPAEDVESVIKTLFDAMRAADGAAFRSAITEDVQFQRVTRKEGKAVLTTSDMEQFIRTVEQSAAGSLDEQLSAISINTDGDLATAWMNYTFYYDGKFSHCGVNSMNLLKTESGWKIFSIVDTRRQDDCA